jgi:hypothetical protein
VVALEHPHAEKPCRTPPIQHGSYSGNGVNAVIQPRMTAGDNCRILDSLGVT